MVKWLQDRQLDKLFRWTPRDLHGNVHCYPHKTQSCRRVVNRIVNSEYFMVVTFKVVHVVRLDKKDAVTSSTLTTLKLSIDDNLTTTQMPAFRFVCPCCAIKDISLMGDNTGVYQRDLSNCPLNLKKKHQ